jgi:hypothetical protein
MQALTAGHDVGGHLQQQKPAMKSSLARTPSLTAVPAAPRTPAAMAASLLSHSGAGGLLVRASLCQLTPCAVAQEADCTRPAMCRLRQPLVPSPS